MWGDQSYKAWLLWLSDYASSVTGAYESADRLPADNWYPTQHVVRIKGIPDSWPNLAKVQVFVHRWDPQRREWIDAPVAFTQALITPRKIINGSLFVLAQPNQREQLHSNGTTLEPGKVQLRLYLDRQERLKTLPALLLNDREPDGTVVLNAKFGKGFKDADILDGIKTPE